jgi:hypothetical protein
VFFYEDRVEVVKVGYHDAVLEVVYRDECTDQPTVKTRQVSSKGRLVISLRGMNAAVRYDTPFEGLRQDKCGASGESDGGSLRGDKNLSVGILRFWGRVVVQVASRFRWVGNTPILYEMRLFFTPKSITDRF